MKRLVQRNVLRGHANTAVTAHDLLLLQITRHQPPSSARCDSFKVFATSVASACLVTACAAVAQLRLQCRWLDVGTSSAGRLGHGDDASGTQCFGNCNGGPSRLTEASSRTATVRRRPCAARRGLVTDDCPGPLTATMSTAAVGQRQFAS